MNAEQDRLVAGGGDDGGRERVPHGLREPQRGDGPERIDEEAGDESEVPHLDLRLRISGFGLGSGPERASQCRIQNPKSYWPRTPNSLGGQYRKHACP